MEQKDYLLREISKIGIILSAILSGIFKNRSGLGDLELCIEHEIESAKAELLKEVNFDLAIFLDLDTEESNEYIGRFAGFDIKNIELLADCLSEIGCFSDHLDKSIKYLKKSLQLYNLCNAKCKTYSHARETNIIAVKNALQQRGE